MPQLRQEKRSYRQVGEAEDGKRIGATSDKALTESLRRLTARRLVERSGRSTARNVSYQLSPLGESLAHGPLAALALWAAEHGDQLDPDV